MMLTLLKRLLLVLSITVLSIPNATAETQDQHLKVAIRTIGHAFLLEINDSTSRILPIEKVDGRYSMQFQSRFSYEPDMLTFATIKVLEENNIAESFIVEVEKCTTNEVVHSFEASLKKKDNMLPCGGRTLPKGCYTFYFTVVEDSAKLLPVEQSENTGFNYLYAILALIIAASVLAYLVRKKKNQTSNPDFINIGQYQFDQKGMLLILKAQTVELSSKESDLLFLLSSNENKTLEREYLLKIVWGDEGDYVGRTLDVFISKLRKKLEADTSIKIVNIRGVGYRFVIN